MNISKISGNSINTFKAQTKITAPEHLLSKEDREYFEELGKRYKTPNDSIEISISELHPSTAKPEVQCYTVEKTINIRTANGNSTDKSQNAIPYIKNGVTVENNSPKNYLSKIFNNLLSK